MQAEIKDGKLVIIVDVSQDALKAAQPSKSSGKTLVVGGSNGHTAIGKFKVNLTVTVPNPNYIAA